MGGRRGASHRACPSQSKAAPPRRRQRSTQGFPVRIPDPRRANQRPARSRRQRPSDRAGLSTSPLAQRSHSTSNPPSSIDEESPTPLASPPAPPPSSSGNCTPLPRRYATAGATARPPPVRPRRRPCKAAPQPPPPRRPPLCSVGPERPPLAPLSGCTIAAPVGSCQSMPCSGPTHGARRPRKSDRRSSPFPAWQGRPRSVLAADRWLIRETHLWICPMQ